MDTSTKAIEIARVARQNSSGLDVRYEQLIDGQPEHIPGYTLVEVRGRKVLSLGKTMSTLVCGFFLNAFPFPMGVEDITNVNGVMVRSFGFRPSRRAVAKAKQRFAERLTLEGIAA
jgi:hypothetical protein